MVCKFITVINQLTILFLCQYRPYNGEKYKRKIKCIYYVTYNWQNKKYIKKCFYFGTTHDYYIKPTCCKKVLYNRHGQFGFHFLVTFLKEYRDWEFFNSWGTTDQILGAINETDSVHRPLFWNFYYIIYFYPSDSTGLAI